ncbi:MAG: hypothetical protein JRN24_04165 [Nitrososphaerota archaeon]|nr:hypothetical protein [Nitrososphaerota archaeon]
MPEEEVSPQTVLELREEILQRVEDISGRVRALSVVTVVVAAFLVVSYVYQIALPFATGETSVTVNLGDPALVAFEVVLTALAAAWLYVGLADYLFVSRLRRSIRVARAKEEELEKAVLRKGDGGESR